MQLPKKDNLLKILFTIILFLLFFIIGSFKLDKIPVINQDEVTFSLGADNISKTGYDLCDKKFPLFPCSLKIFPYQSTTISYYTSALFYKFYTPDSIFDIRIFSVLIGALTGIFALLFFQKLFKSQTYGFIYAVILSVIFYLSPAIFTMQRFGAPYFILSILLQMILFFLIYEFYKTNKKILLLLIPMIASLLMLEYQLYRFFAPLFVLIFVLIFRNEIFVRPEPQKNNLNLLLKIKSILSKNKFIISGLLIFSATSLMIFSQIINDNFTTEYYFNGQNFSIFKLLADLLFHYSLLPFYFYYNLNFFYYLYGFGLFPAISIIFFIFGLICIIKNIKQNNFFKFLVIALLFFPVPSALLGSERFNSSRIMNVIPVYFIISAYGIYALQAYASHYAKSSLKLKKIPPLFLSSIFWLIVILAQNLYFTYDYFYKIPYSRNFCRFSDIYGHNCNFTGLFDYLKNEKTNYNKIYLDEDLLFIGAHVEFFNKFLKYDINNYEVINSHSDINLIKNSILITSKKTAKELNLESKYKLIKTIDELNSQNKFFYIFLIE